MYISGKLIGSIYLTIYSVCTDSIALVTYEKVDICLPWLITFNDTAVINHADMKVSQDFIAGLEITRDGTEDRVNPSEVVDSVGYRYKSFWVANTSYNRPSVHKRFNRSIPSDTTQFIWWNDEDDSCKYTFSRDSLYAVGGSLSVYCEGYLNPVENINNKFLLNTDSTINDSTSLATKLILIDSDPPDSLFIDHLDDTIIMAIAWVEYAGSNDLTHCHNPYNPRYNNYWDHVVDEEDTCFETKFPCENVYSTATGTMQLLRTTWENLFNGSFFGGDTSGFIECSWDSLAWNWAVNIYNGRYVFVDMHHYINNPTNPQHSWDSLYTPASDYSPDSTNREDMAVYGYKWGSTEMLKIRTQKDWNLKVKFDEYINNVRRYKDTKPW